MHFGLALSASLALLCLSAPALPCVVIQPIEPSEADLSWEAQAAGACKSGDFGMFLEAFVRSGHARDAYLARNVKVGRLGKTTRVDAWNYGAIPVALVGHHFIDVETIDRQWVFLQTTLRKTRDGTYRFTWVRAYYDDSGEGDSLGALARTEGPSGYLTFKKTRACWKLTEDIIFAA